MPVATLPSHSHRYGSYLLDLTKNWAYKQKTPGRNREEKSFVQSALLLPREA